MNEPNDNHEETPKDALRGFAWLTVLFLAVGGFSELPGWWKIAVAALLLAGYWASKQSNERA